MFHTLDDYKKDKNTDKDKDKKKKTDSYVGGEASGLAVENPDMKKNLDDLINKAKTGGQEAAGKGERPETNCKISLYANGFTVDDGPFRDYNDPENKKFMDDLNKQQVPQELRKKYPKGLSVGLEDRKSEKFELPPPPSYVAFSGQGVSMSGGPQVSQILEVKNANEVLPPKVDNSKPTTTIRVRLVNGTMVNTTVNHTTKVAELFDYVMDLAPMDGNFQLISGFPPKPLNDPNQTVEDADLLDSTVTQKGV
jgi:UBX domain-containing protein 1